MAINPDAHFGREIYQLAFIDYMLTMPDHQEYLSDYKGFSIPKTKLLANRQQQNQTDAPPLEDVDHAIEGLVGLVVLGEAWQSLDVFWTLRHLLQDRDDHYLAYFVGLRCLELSKQGAEFLDPGVPKGKALTQAIEQHLNLSSHPLYKNRQRRTQRYFRKLRDQSTTIMKPWNDFLTNALQQGRHPDTHHDFWTNAPTIKLPTAPK